MAKKTLSVIFFLIARTVAASCGATEFTLGETVTFSNRSYGRVITTDLNSDGRPDFVTLSSYGLNIALNTPNGLVARPVVDQTAGRSYDSLEVVDFNEDGAPDIVVTDSGLGRLLLFAGGGDGTVSETTLALPLLPGAIGAGDIDGDGHVDLVLTESNGTSMFVYRGDGHGSFLQFTVTTLPAAAVVRLVVADIDHDSKADVLASFEARSTQAVFFGRADGSFDAAVPISTGLSPLNSIAAKDLDGDGDLDIVAGNWSDATVTININEGSRTFSAPVSLATSGTSPTGLVIGDLTGDGLLDIAITLPNSSPLQTNIFQGHGDATFGAAEVVGRGGIGLGAADVDLDGRLDLVLVIVLNGNLTVLNNRCGGTSVNLTTSMPLIGAGDAALITARVAPVMDGAPVPTGSVEFREGAVSFGSSALSGTGMSSMAIPGLAPGDHTITVFYSGDRNYSPASSSILQRVTSETSSMTVTISPSEPVYGGPATITYGVSSTSGVMPGGIVTFALDGVAFGSNYPAPSGSTSTLNTRKAVGTHTLTASYSGDEVNPGKIVQVTFNLVKAGTKLHWNRTPPAVVAFGQTITFDVSIDRSDGGGYLNPTGTITFYDGDVAVGTSPAGSYGPLSLVPAPGAHYYEARYSGDSNFLPSKSSVSCRVAPAGGFLLDARAWIGQTRVDIAMTPVTGASSYKIYRAIAGGAFQLRSFAPDVSIPSPDTIVPDTMYLYVAEAIGSSGTVIARSNVDAAISRSFTDEPITPGTPIRAVHMTEIIETLNLLRNAAGLQPFYWSGSVAGSTVTAADVIAVRESIDAARLSLGIPAAAYSANIAPGLIIRAADFQEMREAVR